MQGTNSQEYILKSAATVHQAADSSSISSFSTYIHLSGFVRGESGEGKWPNNSSSSFLSCYYLVFSEISVHCRLLNLSSKSCKKIMIEAGSRLYFLRNINCKTDSELCSVNEMCISVLASQFFFLNGFRDRRARLIWHGWVVPAVHLI